MQTFLSGLALATISGISWIAYQHPSGYKSIFYGLISFAAFPCLTYIVWKLGILSSTISNIFQLTENKNEKNMERIYDSILKIKNDFDWFRKKLLIAICITSYLVFLFFLPMILNLNK